MYCGRKGKRDRQGWGRTAGGAGRRLEQTGARWKIGDVMKKKKEEGGKTKGYRYRDLMCLGRWGKQHAR